MRFEIDKRFLEHLSNIKQVFLYVIDECNIECKQCLYKPNNTFTLKNKVIDLEIALDLIHDFYDMGARKLTLMGGEPTLYDIDNNWNSLRVLIKEAKSIGYSYVRIDTNGTFDSQFLEFKEIKMLDEITFSLDGPTKEINDPVRGEGVYEKCLNNILYAKELGYNCDITCCIHKGLLNRDSSGELFLHKMIKFAEEIGISRMNFHDIFKGGIPRDVWSGNIDISVDEWFITWDEILEKIDKNQYNIPVRIPQCFTTKDRFDNNKSYYGYCSAKLGDRALVHPNGIIRVCSLMIGTPYGIAKYYDGKIVWDESGTNELGDHKINELTPCTHQKKSGKMDPFYPLCVSFKPKQEEFAWSQLEWEKHRNSDDSRLSS